MDLMTLTFCREEPTTKVETAYQAIEHALENNNPQEVVEYLQALQNFCSYIVSYNKPCILDFQGEVYNSAAASLLQMVHVNYNEGACAVFNEAKRGSTLLGGASYVLSRMPKGVGKYLALTGTPITGSDLFHLKLASLEINLDYETLKFIETEAAKYPRFRDAIVLGLLPPVKAMRMLRDDAIMTRQHERLAKELNARLQARENPSTALIELATKELLMDKAHMMELTTVANNWEKRLEDIKSYNILHTVENRLGFFDEFVLDLVKKNQDEQKGSIANDKGEICQNEGLIKSVFNTDNIDTVIKNLKKSKTAWAQKTLEKLENIDPNVANRILKQIDFATYNDYVSCLVNEYQVALDYFADVTSVKFTDKHRQFNPTAPVKALLPIREYYRDFPDAVRCVMNNTPNSCPFVAQKLGETASLFLDLHGIDIINPVTTLDVAREVLWRRKSIQREIDLENEQRDDVLDNYELRANYLDERKDAIETVTSDPSFNQTVQEAIVEAFNKKLKVTKETLAHKFKGIQVLTRKNKLAKLRKSIIESQLAPLATDVLQKKTRTVYPMEIVEDPLAVNHYVNDKYFITQRADLLQTSLDASPVKIDEYMKGKINIADLVKVDLVDPNIKTLVSDDYFRDYIYYPNRVYFQRYRKLFLDNLHRGNGEDPREVDFREKYIEEQTKEVMKHLQIKETHELRAEIEERLRNLLFDYLAGKDSIYEYNDPHLAKKVELLNAQDAIDMHELTVEVRRELKLEPNFATQLEALTDIRLDSDKKDTLDMQDSSRDFEGYILSNIKENPFLDDRLSFLFESLPKNPIVSKFVVDSKHSLLASFKTNLRKYSSTKGRFNLFPELRGYNSDDASNRYMGQIDAFLKKNLTLDFFDMVASQAIADFSEKMLANLDSLFETAFADVKNQRYLDVLANKPSSNTPEQRESNFRSALAQIAKVNEVTDEIMDESVKFLDKYLLTLAELQHEYKAPSFNPVEVLPRDDMDEQKMSELLTKKFTGSSVIKPRNVKQVRLSQVVSKLVADRQIKSNILTAGGPVRQREIKEKMVQCAQVDPAVENYEDVIRTYNNLKATYMGDFRSLVHSPSALIIELETIIKRMREGTESGVYDDFSKLHKILHDSYTKVNESPETWIQSRVGTFHPAY